MSVLLLLLPCTVLAKYWTGDAWWPVTNFSFEVYNEDAHLFNGWTLLGSEGEVEQDIAYSLHYTASAHITKDTSVGDAYLEQRIDSNTGLDFANQPCYLIAFVKTKGVSSTGTGGIEARVMTDTKNPDTHEEYSSNIIVDDHNWTKLIVPFDSIALDGFGDAITIQIGLFEAKGEAWIDAVQLIPRDSLISQDSAQIPNIKNPSFESYDNDNFDNWLKLTPIGVTITADADNLVLGSKSAKFDFGNGVINRTASLTQSLTVPLQYRTYAFSGFIRTENLDTSGIPSSLGAYCQVSYGGFTWSSQNCNFSNGWTKIQGVFEKPKGTSSSLSVKALVSAKSGKAWFDWLTLRLNYVQNVEFKNWGTIPLPDLAVWKKENISGSGTAGIDPYHGHISNPCGKIYNSSNTYDTVLSQTLGLLQADSSIDEMCLHEGGTYRLTGWIKTESVTPNPIHGQPDIPPNGAFAELFAEPGTPDGTVLLARSECLTEDNDWNEFSLVFSIPLDFFAEEHDEIYMFNTIYSLRCRLHAASGTAYFDDVNIVELEPTEDLATVVPQPQAVSYYGNISDPLVDFNIMPNKVVTIYYTPEGNGVPQGEDTYYFSADYLRQEINHAFYQCSASGDEDNIYQYPIESGNIVCLNASLNATQLLKPCIVIGDPSRDLSQHHLFQNELAKRGVVLPQNFDPEGYLMEISEDVILIAGNDFSGEGVTKGAGSYYGMQTLLQTLEITAESQTLIWEDGISYRANRVQAPALYAYDYPDLPWRGEWYYEIPWDIGSGSDPSGVLVYMFDPDRGDGEQYFLQNERDIALFSALKTNKMYIETGVYYYQATIRGGTTDNYDEYWDRMEDLFACCRQHHIEPIPLLQSGGHSAHILYWHPEFAECMWFGGVEVRPGEAKNPYPDVREMRQFFPDSFALSNPNVFFQPESGLRVRIFSSQTGGTEYLEGVDWTVSYVNDEKPFFRLNPFPGAGGFYSGRAFATIYRIPESQGGHIPPNATVYVSYNCIWPLQNDSCDPIPYCTAAPGLYDYMENVIDTTIDRLNPKYIHLGHDEVLQYHTDERDRDPDFENSLLGDDESNDIPSRLLATDTDKLIDIIKDRPNPPQVILWGDMFNQKHRGEFFCSTNKDDAPGYFKGIARPCDMGGVDEWSGGIPRGKSWQACDLLKDEGHQDTIINDWTGKTATSMNDTTPPIYIGEIIDWQLNSGFTTLGCGYSTTSNCAKGNCWVEYIEYEGSETKLTTSQEFYHPLIFSKDDWYYADNQSYKTPYIDLHRAFQVTDAFVTARIQNYIFGRFWFDDFYLHRTEDSTVNLLNNPSFEFPGSGPNHTFLYWEDNIYSENEDIDSIYRDSQHHFTGYNSCRLIRTESAPPDFTNLFVIQHKSDFAADFQVPGYYILEGYMRAQDVESYVFNNCYNWTHQLHERYARNEDCPGGAYFGYCDVYPSIIQDWLWSINYPHRWWLKSIAMPYDKIGNLCGASYPGFFPLEALYPQEVGK